MQTWLDLARESSKKVIVTSLFESGVGMGGLASFVADQKALRGAMGLHTQSWFTVDTTTRPLPIRNGHLDPEALKPVADVINTAVLEKVL